MANTGVKGRIIDEMGAGVRNLKVYAFDIDPITSDDFLGKTTTNSNGDFEINYAKGAYRAWFIDRNPDIELRIYGPAHRLLHTTPVKEEVVDETHTFDDIIIHKNNAGTSNDANPWLVTNTTLNPQTGDPVMLSQGNQLEWLIDGSTMFPKVTEAIQEAETSINFMNLNFWIAGSKKSLEKNDLLITKFTVNPPELNQQVKGEQCQEIMKTKAGIGAAVKVIVSDVPISSSDTVDITKTYFKNTPVQVRSIDMGLSLLHAKAVSIDQKKCFVIGSTFSQGYFNDEKHQIRDARHRGSLIHDVSVQLTGPAVKHVDQTFASIWNGAAKDSEPLIYSDPPNPDGQNPDGPPVGLQVIRTLPGKFFSSSNQTPPINITHGETGILEAYQRAIANAENYIYIEDQYFTSPEIAKSLISRMKEKENLQLIILVNIAPDIPGYPKKQIGLINQIKSELKDQKNRIGVYTLWSWQKSDEPQDAQKPYQIMPVYVHSKVAIIDDKWATVGSANLDGASLNYIQISDIMKGALLANIGGILILIFDVIAALIGVGFMLASFLGALLATLILTSLGMLGLFIFLIAKWEDVEKIAGLIKEAIHGIVNNAEHADPRLQLQPPRHAELNIAVYNNVGGQPPTDVIHKLKAGLWKEHLGLGNDVLPEELANGGVDFWTTKAQERLAEIVNNSGQSIKILEWQPTSKPKKYLKRLKLETDSITIREKADKFDFLKGIWEPNT